MAHLLPPIVSPLSRVTTQNNIAENYLGNALSIYEELQDPEGIGETLSLLAPLAETEGRIEMAEELYQKSVIQYRIGQLGRHIADSLLRLGRFLIERRGKQDEGCLTISEAIQRYADMRLPNEQEARDIARQLGCSGK